VATFGEAAEWQVWVRQEAFALAEAIRAAGSVPKTTGANMLADRADQINNLISPSLISL